MRPSDSPRHPHSARGQQAGKDSHFWILTLLKASKPGPGGPQHSRREQASGPRTQPTQQGRGGGRASCTRPEPRAASPRTDAHPRALGRGSAAPHKGSGMGHSAHRRARDTHGLGTPLPAGQQPLRGGAGRTRPPSPPCTRSSDARRQTKGQRRCGVNTQRTTSQPPGRIKPAVCNDVDGTRGR